MGRLITFLARIVQNGWADAARGIGTDERTAIVVDGQGNATLQGKGSVFSLQPPGPPEVCQKVAPLTFLDVAVYRPSDPTQAFSLATWSGQGGTACSL